MGLAALRLHKIVASLPAFETKGILLTKLCAGQCPGVRFAQQVDRMGPAPGAALAAGMVAAGTGHRKAGHHKALARPWAPEDGARSCRT